MDAQIQARAEAHARKIEDALEANLLWNGLISEVRPPKEQFILWIDRYGLELVSRAIKATAKKAMKLRSLGTPIDDTIAKYASACMRNMRETERFNQDMESRGFDPKQIKNMEPTYAPGGGLMIGGGRRYGRS